MRTAARERITAVRAQLTQTKAALDVHRKRAAKYRYQIAKTNGRIDQFTHERTLLPVEFSAEWGENAQELQGNLGLSFLEVKAAMAAYEVVAAAHRLALGAAYRELHPLPDDGAIPAPANPLAHAINYTGVLADLRDGWNSGSAVPLSAERVEFVLVTWAKVPQARILLDASGTYTVAMPESFIELRPVDEPMPTEGDVLHAALAAYGLPSYPMSECGITYRVIPLDIAATGEAAHTGPRLFVMSDERATRPIENHDQPWTITLHDADGEEIRTLYRSHHRPGGIAEESADCGTFAASWIRDNAHAYLSRS
ncbi:hypothetical protein ACIBMX_10660 [Streptomyces phaeochromogenes]|uniref:hypothetical protein n=1 Tax=Streptomyces phaeochromogenes TaxID=1923 RepID=UPI00340E0295